MKMATQKQIKARKLNWLKLQLMGARININPYRHTIKDIIPIDIKEHLYKAYEELNLALDKWPSKNKINEVNNENN